MEETEGRVGGDAGKGGEGRREGEEKTQEMGGGDAGKGWRRRRGGMEETQGRD